MGFSRKQRRPVEWITSRGAAEVWSGFVYPMTMPALVNWVPTQTGVGTPASDQMDVLIQEARQDGGISTLTRIVGDLHIAKRQVDNGAYYGLVRCGFQLVPYRQDNYADPRLLFDADDNESKEWVWQRTYGPGDHPLYAVGEPRDHLCQKPSSAIDIKSQRRYDTSLYALCFSMAASANLAQGDIKWGLNGRLLYRTGTGLH